MTAKKNPLLTKSEALAIAWKQRADYKGYDKSKGGSYNSWRSIINTQKGRKIGFPESWKNHQVFMADVQGAWEFGKIVCRFNKSLPHGADNSYWAEKGTEHSGRLIQITYNGETKTLMEWAAQYGLNYQGVRQRYFRGKSLSVEEIIFGKKRVFKTQPDIDKSNRLVRMLGAYKLTDKKKGFVCDIDLMWLKNFIASGCYYCGDNFRVGIDRIDNGKGHTKDNVVPCCYDCNVARANNFSLEEMIVIGKAIQEVKKCRLAKKN